MTRSRAALVVALVGAALYLTTLGNGFVMDDGYNVVRNTEIRSLANVPGMFLSAVGADSDDLYERQINQSYWRPLASTSFALDHAIWGLRPAGFHLTNVLLYAALCALVALVLGRLTSPGGALAGGLWYAVHPVHAEAVNLVTYRTELLAALAVAGALALLTGGDRRPRNLLLIPLVYAAGLLSKESAATLPAWLLATELVTRRGRLLARPWWPLYGALAAVLAAWLVARAALLTPTDVRFFGDLDGPLVFMSAMKIYGLYVRLLVLPWPLTPFYDWTILPPASSLADPVALAGLAALVVTIGLVIALRRRAPLVAMGLGCWLVGLLPFSQLVPLPVGAAERFLLIPTIGIAVVVAAAGHALARRRLMVAGALVLAGYAAMVLTRNGDWESDLALQEATVAAWPESFNAHHVLGQLYLDAGRVEDAVETLSAADHLLPGVPPNTALLARALVRAGRPVEAVAAVDRALARVGPDPALLALRREVQGALPSATPGR
ncbi:MAG: hypothetical protein AMXMBFR64_03620 [Myxococcales bacterium]